MAYTVAARAVPKEADAQHPSSVLVAVRAKPLGATDTPCVSVRDRSIVLNAGKGEQARADNLIVLREQHDCDRLHKHTQ